MHFFPRSVVRYARSGILASTNQAVFHHTTLGRCGAKCRGREVVPQVATAARRGIVACCVVAMSPASLANTIDSRIPLDGNTASRCYLL